VSTVVGAASVSVTLLVGYGQPDCITTCSVPELNYFKTTPNVVAFSANITILHKSGYSYTYEATYYWDTSPGAIVPSVSSVIEALQVTQSFATDTPSYAPTPLIAGKTTTIRLYPIQDNPAGPVGGQIKVISDHLLGTLTAPYDLTPQSSVNRDYSAPRSSFDFEIPAAWTTKGDLTVGGLFLDRG